MVGIATGAFIAIQIGSGYWNQRKASQLADKLQQQQQRYEEALLKEGMEQAQERYEQLCLLQKEVEAELHRNRLSAIELSFQHQLDLKAYSKALEGWPLVIPPFVMKNETVNMLSEGGEHSKVGLHCILTYSNDESFNKGVFKELENNLYQYFNTYWGANSSHPVIFYSCAWREFSDTGSKIHNIHAHLEHLPTLVISPHIATDNSGLSFIFSYWGMQSTQLIDREIKPEYVTFDYTYNHLYTAIEKKQVLRELTPALSTFISFIADQYYWTYNRIPPLLPSFLGKAPLECGEGLKQQYIGLYKKMYERYIDIHTEEGKNNLLVFPEQALELCKAISPVCSFSEFREMADRSLFAICQSRGKEVESLTVEKIFTSGNIFFPQDVSYIKRFNEIYKTENSEPVSKQPGKKEIQIHKNKTGMKPHVYNQRRNELVSILGDVIRIDGLKDDERQEFMTIRKKIWRTSLISYCWESFREGSQLLLMLSVMGARLVRAVR